MIKLTAKISVLDDTGITLSSASIDSDNLSLSNISSGIGNILNVKKQARNPFIMGKNKIGDGSTLSNGESYFILRQFTNENKTFTDTYTLTINGTNITHFTIAFDTFNNIYPTMIKVDNVDYENDDTLFSVANLTSASSHTVEISNLNVANAQLVITGIYVGIEIDINDKSLISLTRKISDRADNKFPSWGIISNVGDIEFNDFSGEIKDYAEMLLLKQGLSVIINIKDTLSQKEQQIGKFATNTWNYDNDSKKITLSLQDELLEWQDILIEEYPLTIGTNMNTIYNYLYSITPAKYNMISSSQLDEKTQLVLAYTRCEYAYIEKGSLWSAWQKLCEICALHIYKNNSGTTICTFDFRS